MQKQWIEFNEKLVVYENYLYRIITEASLDFAVASCRNKPLPGLVIAMAIGQSVLGFATTLPPPDRRHTGHYKTSILPLKVYSIFTIFGVSFLVKSSSIKTRQRTY